MTNNNTNTLNHIAIIMDGNGRWAEKNKLLKIQGHKKGYQSLKNIITYCAQIQLSSLTVFAFSSENINRPKNEVGGLFKLFLTTLKNETKTLKENNIKLNLIGDLSIFPKNIQKQAVLSVDQLSNCNGLTLNIALNYGGRWDIINATKSIADQVAKGLLQPQDIDEKIFSKNLSLTNQPDVDLIIRSSGEHRISNFLLWDLAYSELFFTSTLWPDFNVKEFKEIINQYQNRLRRFGK